MYGPDQKNRGTPMYRVVTTGGTLDADRIAKMRARLRSKLDAQEAAIALSERMRQLARNLRDAAGCALAFDLGERLGAWYFNELDKRPAPWDSNRVGQPAPRWER